MHSISFGRTVVALSAAWLAACSILEHRALLLGCSMFVILSAAWLAARTIFEHRAIYEHRGKIVLQFFFGPAISIVVLTMTAMRRVHKFPMQSHAYMLMPHIKSIIEVYAAARA